MMITRCVLLSALILTTTSSVRGGFLIPNTSRIGLEVNAFGGLSHQTDFGRDYQGSSIAPLQISARAEDSDGSSVYVASAGLIALAFSSSDEGYVLFDLGTRINNPNGVEVSSSVTPFVTDTDNIVYNFTPTVDGTFSLEYEISDIFSPSPLFGTFVLSLPGGGSLVLSDFGTGSVEVELVASVAVALAIRNENGISGNPQALSAESRGVFAFHFRPTAVPEPSSFALLGLGSIGLIGVRLRRRRSK